MNIQQHYRALTQKLLAIVDNDERLYRMRSKLELCSSQTIDNIQVWVETMFPTGFEGCPRSEFPFLDYQYMRNFWMGLVPSPKTDAGNETMKLSVLLTSKGCEDCPYAEPTRLLSRFELYRPLECTHPHVDQFCGGDNRVPAMPERPEWCPLMDSSKPSTDP